MGSRASFVVAAAVLATGQVSFDDQKAGDRSRDDTYHGDQRAFR